MLTTTGKFTKFGTLILTDDGKRAILDKSFRGSVRLNRSRKWLSAKTYQQAREMSPSTRIVR